LFLLIKLQFSHDLYDEPGGSSRGDPGSKNVNPTWTTTNANNGKTTGSFTKKATKVCERETGIRRYINSDAIRVDSHELAQNEEVMSKMSVYFWHNFTLNSHSANFVDAITNYHLSKEDIACPSKPEYVQMVTVVSKSKSSKSSIIIII